MSDRQALTEGTARKSLGQHFLHDPDILRRTALAAGRVEGRTVIEVGPGPGGLTRALLEEGARKVIAVEADRYFADALKTWPAFEEGRLCVVAGDARRANWPLLIREFHGETPAMIVANLPYNVGTILLVEWLKAGDWRGPMSLMFQKEVAERIVAKPGSDEYGRLAVLAQATTKAHIAFTLPPGAFRPPPKVDSAVAVLEPLSAEARFERLDLLETVTTAAFTQRRKMLRTSLKKLAQKHGMGADAWLHACEIDPRERPENLTQEQFRCLAAYLVKAEH